MNANIKPNCQDPAIDPDIFFAPMGDTEFADAAHRRLWQYQTAEALEICATCPVIQECLTYSYQTPESANVGIYGGLTPVERLNLINLTPNTYITVRMEQLERFYNPARTIATNRGVPFPDVHAPKIRELSWVEQKESVSQLP